MTHVFKLTTSEVNELKALINQLGVTTTTPPHTHFQTKINGCTLTLYTSNKFMIQGQNAQHVINKLFPKSIFPTIYAQTKADQKDSPTIKQHIQYDQYNTIGSDEAGSGDYFGPMTVCAAYVPKDKVQLLKTIGVKDSKALKDYEIKNIAQQIIQIIPYTLYTIDNPKYNTLKEKNWSQVKMKAKYHQAAIESLTNKIDPTTIDCIVIDQFAKKETYTRYNQSLIYPEITHFETKGESKAIAIAAASIIARSRFVQAMDDLKAQYHMEVPKGAAPKVDIIAARWIEKYGVDVLDKVTKKDFKNRQKAMNLIGKKKRSK
ncbi:ribonuclease HIII [Abyssicoccus albus]|uniref:ribonuclease HIII n=1 Tax=Abyssicoccus albus TaxID=1817405 RepID=UPI00097E231A|nr:ribonuclease HIII [Abyssicoccus albus]AQL56456.1 ribonuclease HIII [Abyssicoccus albus]